MAGVLVLIGLLLALSPGKPYPLVDPRGPPLPGSLSEKIWVNINGMQQGMFIQSKDSTNPVLLFLHGGPGMPEYWMTQRYPTGLEAYFTVVWWDQRGTGLSYTPGPFWGDFLWYPGGGPLPRVVPRLHWHGADGLSA